MPRPSPEVLSIVTRPRRACRRFTIADAMVLVAASAAIFLVVRETWTMRGLAGDWLRHGYLNLAYELTACAATPLLLACLPLRLRRPGPGWRRLCRQPGFVASMAATASLVPGLMPGLVEAAKSAWYRQLPSHPVRNIFYWHYENATAWTLWSIAGAWAALAASGRWRAESGWIDRLGRSVGFAWIGLGVIHAIYAYTKFIPHWI